MKYNIHLNDEGKELCSTLGIRTYSNSTYSEHTAMFELALDAMALLDLLKENNISYQISINK